VPESRLLQPSLSQEVSFRLLSSMSAISAPLWAECFGEDMPFTRYEYLLALELSACCSQESGWQGSHLEVSRGGTVIALMPLYIKTHSYGEYVFDWAWADAYQQHQLPYYPKLLSAVPFTPVTGKRIGFTSLVSTGDYPEIMLSIKAFLSAQMHAQGYSSWHCLFMNAEQRDLMTVSPTAGTPFTAVPTETTFAPEVTEAEPLQRLGTQFHWFNRDYHHFDDFLQALTSKKRKLIRKERESLTALGLSFEFIAGDKVTQAQWQDFSLCYKQTYMKRSGHKGYLNNEFFQMLGDTMGASVRLLRVNNSQGNNIANALYFVSSTHLYGRYWGALEDIPGLHFEACYYQGIEYAIAQGLSCFDAGAQGEHKVFRGFEPVAMHSFHDIAHPSFKAAIGAYCQQESRNMQLYMAEQAKNLPYKNSQ
jgi:predicted N-acyltransferase